MLMFASRGLHFGSFSACYVGNGGMAQTNLLHMSLHPFLTADSSSRRNATFFLFAPRLLLMLLLLLFGRPCESVQHARGAAAIARATSGCGRVALVVVGAPSVSCLSTLGLFRRVIPPRTGLSWFCCWGLFSELSG